jgi:probable rRNA maturation factor
MIIYDPQAASLIGDTAEMPVRSTLQRALLAAQQCVALKGEVTVMLTDDKGIRSLNRSFRGKNKPTDILSFPAADPQLGIAGDLAISVETAARQAASEGHPLRIELRILILHGVLHLAGYDHEADSGQMASLECDLRRKLRLPQGLIERATAPHARYRKARL